MTLWTGAAKRLDDIDLPRIGHRIGVGEDEIHALLDVESRGKGFDSEGRVIMLFEPHIFWRQLELAGDTKGLERAVSAGLAYPKWGEKRYPSDSYPRLIAATAINERAAMRSASWGLGQIMGFNASTAGYDTAKEMVQHFADDEEHQLDAMVTFIITADLDDELRRHDWAGFARGYNGKSFAKHNYHGRLAARFEWWQGKPDTPWSPADMGRHNPASDLAA